MQQQEKKINEPKRMHATGLFINLHWLPIKLKALMFAYKTTSGSAPLYLNSLLQTYVPLEAYVLQVNNALLSHPKEAQNHFHGLLTVPSWWNDLPNSIPAAEYWAIFKNRLKTPLPSLFDPLTLALSILILFFKKDLHSIHLLTACFL